MNQSKIEQDAKDGSREPTLAEAETLAQKLRSVVDMIYEIQDPSRDDWGYSTAPDRQRAVDALEKIIRSLHT